jgi:tyrosyl-tRNA synthetase
MRSSSLAPFQQISIDQQISILTGGCVDVFSPHELGEKLARAAQSGTPLRVKYGADPSSPDLHLGHTVPLRKLRQFQDLGHLVVFIIGDFTARIGDPSHKSETRPMLSQQTIAENAKTYQDQVFRILDPARTEVRHNSQWLGCMGADDFLGLMAKATVARILERDDFSKRYKNGQPISLLEFMYPMLQGWDSVVLEADIELGGTDQTFNLLMGRDLQSRSGQASQVVMTTALLEGTDGVQKMSKSLSNTIAINDTPQEMFGKMMSVPDNAMMAYARLACGWSSEIYQQLQDRLVQGENPRNIKAHIAGRLVELFYDQARADQASQEFTDVFRAGAIPQDIPQTILSGPTPLVDALVQCGLAESKSQARRAIEAGAVKIDSKRQGDPSFVIDADLQGCVLQNGKRLFSRLIFSA